MIQKYRNQSGHEFTSLPISPIEIYTDSDSLEHVYIGNTVTAQNGERFTVLDSRHVQGRTYRITLLPTSQEVN